MPHGLSFVDSDGRLIKQSRLAAAGREAGNGMNDCCGKKKEIRKKEERGTYRLLEAMVSGKVEGMLEGNVGAQHKK